MSATLRRTAALAVVATALGLAAGTPAIAQRPTTFPTDAAAIKRIWQIGMDSSRVEALGQALLDSIGPRLTGSPGMLAWSPGTKGQPVKAEAIILPKFRDSTEFVAWLPKARGKIVMLSPSFPTCRPDSTKLYRGTGYGMGLGTGTLGMRLEKAGVVGMIKGSEKPDEVIGPAKSRG
jgi:hypothetical protein